MENLHVYAIVVFYMYRLFIELQFINVSVHFSDMLSDVLLFYFILHSDLSDDDGYNSQ